MNLPTSLCSFVICDIPPTGDGSEYLQQLDACIYKLGPWVKYSGNDLLPPYPRGVRDTTSLQTITSGSLEIYPTCNCRGVLLIDATWCRFLESGGFQMRRGPASDRGRFEKSTMRLHAPPFAETQDPLSSMGTRGYLLTII